VILSRIKKSVPIFTSHRYLSGFKCDPNTEVIGSSEINSVAALAKGLPTFALAILFSKFLCIKQSLFIAFYFLFLFLLTSQGQ